MGNARPSKLCGLCLVSPQPCHRTSAGSFADVHLLIPAIDDVFEIYWNGVKVGQFGNMPPNLYWLSSLAPQIFNLGPARSGVLAIRVWKTPLPSNDPGTFGGFEGVPADWQPGRHCRRKRRDGVPMAPSSAVPLWPGIALCSRGPAELRRLDARPQPVAALLDGGLRHNPARRTHPQRPRTPLLDHHANLPHPGRNQHPRSLAVVSSALAAPAARIPQAGRLHPRRRHRQYCNRHSRWHVVLLLPQCSEYPSVPAWRCISNRLRHRRRTHSRVAGGLGHLQPQTPGLNSLGGGHFCLSQRELLLCPECRRTGRAFYPLDPRRQDDESAILDGRQSHWRSHHPSHAAVSLHCLRGRPLLHCRATPAE